MFSAALLTTTKTWEQPKGPSRDKWINKTWYTCKMEYYSAIKRRQFHHFVTTWINANCISIKLQSGEVENFSLKTLLENELQMSVVSMKQTLGEVRLNSSSKYKVWYVIATFYDSLESVQLFREGKTACLVFMRTTVSSSTGDCILRQPGT